MVKGSCFVYVVWKSYYRDNISSVEFVKAIKLFIMSFECGVCSIPVLFYFVNAIEHFLWQPGCNAPSDISMYACGPFTNLSVSLFLF